MDDINFPDGKKNQKIIVLPSDMINRVESLAINRAKLVNLPNEYNYHTVYKNIYEYSRETCSK